MPIERARVSLLQRDFADFLSGGRLLLPAGQRVARRYATRAATVGSEEKKRKNRPNDRRLIGLDWRATSRVECLELRASRRLPEDEERRKKELKSGEREEMGTDCSR